MNILVVGGTGIIGTGIVEAAVAKGHSVTALSRQEKPIHDKLLDVRYIQTNWSDTEQAKSVMKKIFVDVIVDGLVFTEAELKRDLQLINGHCSQYIYISSAAVYEHPVSMATEDSAKDVKKLKWSYALNKRKAEIYLENHYDDYDFMITTVRPCVTYGDTRIPVGVVGRANQWTLIKRIIDGKPIVFVKDGGSKHSIAHISTFGDAVTELFLNSRADRQIYHVADDYAYSWDEIIYEVGKILGIRPNVIHVPVEALKDYNRSLYDEMRYDKIEEFTLDNSRIKSLSPNTIFHISLANSLKSTIKHLEGEYSSRLLDTEFDEMCDMILCGYDNYSLPDEENKIVSQYLQSLGRKQLKRFKRKSWGMQVKNVCRFIKKMGTVILKNTIIKAV